MSLNFIKLLTRKAPELPEGCTWINSAEPLSLQKLKWHVVILDFWSCYDKNGMNSLPLMSAIASKYRKDPVVVIGVHSSKASARRPLGNITSAAQAKGIRYPIVVDKGMRIWHRYFVTEHPTTVVVGPNERIAFKLAGECSLEQMSRLIDDAMDDARRSGTLARKRISIRMPEAKSRPGNLM